MGGVEKVKNIVAERGRREELARERSNKKKEEEGL